MSFIRAAVGVIALGLALGAAAQPARAQAFAFTPAEQAKVKALLPKVEESDGVFRVAGERWRAETQVSARFTAELVVFMDLFAAVFDGQAGSLMPGPAADVTPTVVVYANKSAYEQRYADGSRGYFDYKHDGAGAYTEFHLYTYVAGDAEKSFATFYHPILQHEGTHALLRQRVGKADLPVWLDEGLATYFQFWLLREDATKNRRVRFGRSIYKRAVAPCVAKGGTLPSLPELLSLKHAEWNPDQMGPKASLHYGLAETFVQMLLESKDGQKVLKDALASSVGGSAPNELLPAALVKKLEPVWHEHIRARLR